MTCKTSHEMAKVKIHTSVTSSILLTILTTIKTCMFSRANEMLLKMNPPSAHTDAQSETCWGMLTQHDSMLHVCRSRRMQLLSGAPAGRSTLPPLTRRQSSQKSPEWAEQRALMCCFYSSRSASTAAPPRGTVNDSDYSASLQSHINI